MSEWMEKGMEKGMEREGRRKDEEHRGTKSVSLK